MARPPLYPDEETYALTVRMPLSMKKDLAERAQQNRRSMNQEVIWLLEQILAQVQEPTDEQSSR